MKPMYNIDDVNELLDTSTFSLKDANEIYLQGIEEKDYDKIINGLYQGAANLNELAKKITYLKHQGIDVILVVEYLSKIKEKGEQHGDK